jgi:PAS domain S-box-containing protein
MKEYEKRYKELLNEMFDGYALHEIICNDKGEPIDYRFLEVNSVFEKMTGLKAESIIGHTCLEILPNTELSLIERYGKVALTGGSSYFESFSPEIDHYFEVKAFRTEPNQFVCTFKDITELKKSSKKLLKDIELLTIYEGKQIEDGKKAVSIKVTLGDDTRTLKPKEIEKTLNDIIASMESKGFLLKR